LKDIYDIKSIEKTVEESIKIIKSAYSETAKIL